MIAASTVALALLGARPAPVPAPLVAVAVPTDVAARADAGLVTAPVAPSAVEDQPARPAFNYRRAGWQIGAAMGVGVIWYQSQIELNKLDFDFDRTWSDQWRRLSTGAGYRLDDNNPTLNVGHAFMGTIYHEFARANGGGMGEALLFDFVTSSTWEVAVEHREVVSVNDTIVTSLGGVALGESLFQLGDYFARSRPTVVNRLLMSLFCPARALSWLSGDLPAPSRAPEDSAGLAGDAQHRFALVVGGAQALGPSAVAAPPVAGPEAGSAAGAAAGTSWQGEVGLDLELLNLPEYGHEGSTRRRLHGGEFTHIQAEYVGNRDQMRHGTLSARTSMWGRYSQSTTAVDGGGPRSDERLVGSAIFLGSASAFDLSSDELPVSNDFVAAVHLLGPALDATWFRDRWTFRAGADVTPDFAMVRPFALREVPTGGARAGMKSTLQDSDYYYAFGVASAARLETAYRKARAGLAVSYSHHDSIEGLDRHQEAYTSPTGIHHDAITKDDNLTDQRLKLRIYSEAPLPIPDVTVGVSVNYQRRSGSAADLHRAADDLRWGVHAAYAM